jgi:hydroxylamine reductase
MNMFCYQCEQTSRCRRTFATAARPQTATFRTSFALKDISRYAHRARQLGATDGQINVFTVKAFFSTLTNVNFSPARFQILLNQAASIREKAISLYESACKKAGKKSEQFPCDPQWWTGIDDIDALIETGALVGVQERINKLGPDVAGLQEIIVYGLKGMSYMPTAQILRASGRLRLCLHSPTSTGSRKTHRVRHLFPDALSQQAINLKVMELLNRQYRNLCIRTNTSSSTSVKQMHRRLRLTERPR